MCLHASLSYCCQWLNGSCRFLKHNSKMGACSMGSDASITPPQMNLSSDSSLNHCVVSVHASLRLLGVKYHSTHKLRNLSFKCYSSFCPPFPIWAPLPLKSPGPIMAVVKKKFLWFVSWHKVSSNGPLRGDLSLSLWKPSFLGSLKRKLVGCSIRFDWPLIV